MTGVPKGPNQEGKRMSDYDEGNGSGGIISTIISILILAAIWPYLLAILAIYITYLAAIAAIEWMAQHPMTVVLIISGALTLYATIYYRLIPKVWKWLVAEIRKELKIKTQCTHGESRKVSDDLPDLSKRAFIPSTNLYCYWCTKKLGKQAFQRAGKYYCKECQSKQLTNP